VIIEFDDSSAPANLICPKCQGQYLQHDAITIFERDEEDAPSHALHVEGGRLSKIEGAQADRANPSLRRNGVSVRFWCESCRAIQELTIEQHKGSTYMRWREIEQAEVAS